MRRLILLLICLSILASLAAREKASVLKSLLVPGWGQISAGHDYGYAMLGAELGIIGSLFYLNSESDAFKQDSYEYAIKFAHLNPADYDNDFFNHLARYESSGFDAGGYNAWVLKTAMDLYPYDPVQQQEYIQANSYGADRYWYWDGSEHRSKYNKLRNRSQDYLDYAKEAGGVLILKHLVGVVDVLRLNAEKRRSYISFDMMDKTPLLQVNYNW